MHKTWKFTCTRICCLLYCFAVFVICNWICSITEYNPDRGLLPFSLHTDENGIESFAYNFRHLMIGRIFYRLAPGSIHFKSCFSLTALILLVPRLARGILIVMWLLALEGEFKWWAVGIFLTVCLWITITIYLLKWPQKSIDKSH